MILIKYACAHVYKFGNFRENFSVYRHICDVKISQVGHDLPILVNIRVISPRGLVAGDEGTYYFGFM